MSLKWQIPGGIMLFVTDHAAIRNCAIFTLEVHFAVVIKAILQVFVSLLEICTKFIVYLSFNIFPLKTF